MEKKRRKINPVIAILLILVIGVGGYFLFFWKNYSFEVSLKLNIPNSSQHMNATWWGYHQSKIVSIGDTTFTYYIDNSTQNNGVSNINNPNKAIFLKIKNGEQQQFGFANTSRPCNVLADVQRGKVYFVVLEPTSEVDSGTEGRIMLYTYNYNNIIDEITFENAYQVVAKGDNGQIRTSATIDDNGNIAIAHGGYDSYMYVYIYDIENEEWNDYRYLSNDEDEELLYPYVILKDLDTFYLLPVQDTNVYGTNYYQFVKFFSYDNGVWLSEMVVDYRNLAIAKTKPQLVEQTEFYLDGEDIHIFTRARLGEKADSIINHFIYKEGVLSEIDAKFLNKDYSWVKLIRFNSKLYYICTVDKKLVIIDYETKETVFSETTNVKGLYMYINKKWSGNSIQVMLCSGNSSNFNVDTMLYQISLKE
jgi:hypothetical protein